MYIQNMENNILAYLKYDGKKVEEGYLDIRKSAEALTGLDEIKRYFLYQEDPEIQKYEFEIPIQLKKGSWEILIPENVDDLFIKGVVFWGITKYFGTMVGEMAKNDIGNYGFKDLLKKSMNAFSWVLQIGKHLGTMKKDKFTNVKFKDNNTSIGIPNDNNELLFVPSECIDHYVNCPPKIFSKIADVIEEERELKLGIKETNGFAEITININQKNIFTSAKEDDVEILFPELRHNDYVELEGHITRGNEKSNTIGFLYEGHILTCYPNVGNIYQNKDKLFSNCILKGYVDRQNEEGEIIEKRPRIKYIDLIISYKNKDKNLFE